jgi:hypothetical protein
MEENESLKERLLEAEQTIQAIHSGEVDALIIQKPDGEQLYSLTGADHGYRVLVESIQEGALILSADDSIYYCNRTFGNMLQVPTKKITGTHLESYFQSEIRLDLIERIRESRNCGTAKGEFLIRRSDGSNLPVNISFNFMRFEDFSGVCAIIADLTEQKKVEEELRRHRTELQALVDERTSDLARTNTELQREIGERKQAQQESKEAYETLNLTLESITDGFFSLDREWRFKWLNNHGASLMGISAEDSIGKSIWELFPHAVARKFYSESLKAAETGQPVHFEEFYPEPLNMWYEAHCYPSSEGMAIYFRDIIDRKRMEEELIQINSQLEDRVRERTAELRISNKALMEYAAKLERLNEELQEFAFVASHDLQEPLRKIQTFGHLLGDKCRDALPETGQDYLNRMTASAKRMSDLLQSLLNYSRIATRSNPLEPIDLASVARDAVSDLELLIQKENGTVEIGELPRLNADPAQIRQLIQNLVSNSMKFRSNADDPVVRIYGYTDGGTCTLYFQDNGIGFDEKYLDRIFRPFQQLHGRSAGYGGTGMGLAICRKIVERHGGNISAKSTRGQGATFIVQLPAARPERETG